jgi:hypothetical protein
LLAKCKIDSWTYTDAMTYGSRENEKAINEIQSVTIAADRKSVHLHMADFATPAKVVNRLLHLKIESPQSLFSEVPAFPILEAYQTIRALPKP